MKIKFIFKLMWIDSGVEELVYVEMAAGSLAMLETSCVWNGKTH